MRHHGSNKGALDSYSKDSIQYLTRQFLTLLVLRLVTNVIIHILILNSLGRTFYVGIKLKNHPNTKFH